MKNLPWLTRPSINGILALALIASAAAFGESEQVLIAQMAMRAGQLEQAGFSQGVWQANLAEFEGPIEKQGRTQECTAYAIARALGIRHSFDYYSFDFVDPVNLWSKYEAGNFRAAVKKLRYLSYRCQNE